MKLRPKTNVYSIQMKIRAEIKVYNKRMKKP